MSRINVSIGSIEIPVRNLVRAIGWYSEVFGYVCTWSDENHAMLSKASGDRSVSIFLVQTDDVTGLSFRSTKTNVTHSVLDFETDDLDGFHSWLAQFSQDLPPIPEPANEWAPRGFSFLDSEGNRLAVFCFVKAS